MNYILDTNTLSALLKSEIAAVNRLKNLARSQVSIPQPVIAEIEYGLARLPKSNRKARLEDRWKIFVEELKRSPWTDEVSKQFGLVKASLERRGERIEDFDVAIAAHALANDAVLVTSDKSHMKRVRNLKIDTW